MDALDVSRWQFGITTVYHFIFVPLTIGLAPLIAAMQTAWVITGNNAWYRLTRFFGKLFLINFALGVATGIVQEFQFGMNWSEYSRFVGDIFGAPLAMEGLVAFFFESTFIGLWIFGWTRLPRLLHLACIWIVAIAVNLSAFFIIAANSWMQHPVGAHFNPETGRAELTSIGALFTNNTAIAAFSHAVFGAFLTAGTFVAGVCAWWLMRSRDQAANQTMFRNATVMGCLVVLVSTLGLVITGDIQGKLMFQQQPMKMASAESLCHTETDPNFSVLTVGTHNNCDGVIHLIEVPYVLPFLAEGQFEGVRLEGVENLQQQYVEKFGPGNYRPNLFVTYWSFRVMIGLLAIPTLFALYALWATRGGRVPRSPWFSRFALLSLPMPFLANSAGWVFTEMGRQPWVVAPNPTGDQLVRLTIAEGVSDHSTGLVVLSLVAFTLIYGVLAVIWFWLIRRYVGEGPQEHDSEPVAPPPPDQQDVAPLSFAY
ncbi:cytochrome ubiquinol oxidase subunit [Mycolicibacterium phlei]|jgi:cytochrome d ubiquinol oxidase subunit I|uniref:Cytochrome BD ubiquinol oxidase subunit I n=1 Tax=Mycolicibacterium phlei DSM 43239 = CCUG 21000 TaxID=1226750 RepID=A0A5N5V6P5_MYCPH|nr:cytochrome ubiquinol oxidase subunit I [Mycolicibacterium phlei]VEG09702.1 cytochrome ubiquinol oxidase subunit [Mycobacteroides chelonae]AMO61594.1 Cytochrome bd-II ubiquinol oxidase subunit 1 [Mycolicibacterium phlei]EID18081.1 cytochrome D ubiquinol oxidase subunit 1 [Mycolicibacterium phlei RIVM601174]KAB7757585.1 cytochrome BD ubiquinol oxidase subunit I [Mycolicibacterium phlei DSM 43239 = CCUG 21000]KXW67781.1 cytochrome BD ubiquinol oxidase subunit I [Mycolicibacterium phlei DSM 432